MRENWLEGCIHYGSQFEKCEEKKEEKRERRFSPLFMRLCRHTTRGSFPW